MGKKLLREYYELCEGGVCQDLLTEEEKRFVSEGGMILTVKLQEGGEALTEAVTQDQMRPTAITAGSPSVSPMSFDELREKLPDYISDDVVKLLSENPMA